MTLSVRVTRRRAIAAIIALVLIASTVALAAWLISSQGGGKGRGGALAAPTVTPGTNGITAELFPGSDGDLSVKVANPNGAMVITGVSLGTNGTYESSSDPTGCPSTFVTVNNLTGLSIPVPPKTTTDNIVIPNALHMASNAPSECQGVVFTKPVKADFSTP